MSKKLNKIIMDDFNKTYLIELDKEKIYKNIQVKEEKEDNIQTVLYFKRLCKRISVAACLIIVCLIAVIGVIVGIDYEGADSDVVTKEFEEYMEEYTNEKQNSLYSSIQLQEYLCIYIYKVDSQKMNKEYYFFFVKNVNEIGEYTLLFKQQEASLKDDTYGLLCEFLKDDTNKDICFSIEYNGKITDYKIG